MNEDRPLPSNDVAERLTLGSIFHGSQVFDRVREIVQTSDFRVSEHRTIFSAFVELEGQAVDLFTVREHLKETGKLEDAGGTVFLASLTDGIPDVANAEKYAQAVRESSQRRAAIALSRRLEAAAFNGESMAEIAANGAQAFADFAAASEIGKHEDLLVAPAELSNLLERYYADGVPRGLSTGWPSLDKLFTVRKGEFTVITGVPSHGKTSVLDAMLVNLATLHGWRCGIFSAENLPIERHASGLAERIAGKYFGRPDDDFRMSCAQLAHAAEFISAHFRFIRAHEDGQSLETIFEAMRELVELGTDAIVLDPWNEIDHAIPKGMNETDYVDVSLRKLRRFARFHAVHLVVVAHPAKMYRGKDGNYPVPTLYDISGSSHWRNKADNGIVVWRDMLDESAGTSIYVQKIRFREVGKVGTCVLRYQQATGRYLDDAVKADRRQWEVA